ncbi:MAG: hypothetical protein N4A54_05330 [Peptostreptococcaceae bacterium]|jgi:hypothetical protein|nr:hypothetical protein [Peptostreptococcaceae bacterium]
MLSNINTNDLEFLNNDLSSTIKILNAFSKSPACSNDEKQSIRRIIPKLNEYYRESSSKLSKEDNMTREDYARLIVGKEMCDFLDNNNFVFERNINKEGIEGWVNGKIIVRFNGKNTEDVSSLKSRYFSLHRSRI